MPHAPLTTNFNIVSPKDAIVPVICSHWCPRCKRAWNHKKLKSGVCAMRYDNFCPKDNEANAKLVERYAAELAQAQVAQGAVHPPAKDCTEVLDTIEALASIQRGEE
jgi:hypothetical protein